MEKSTSKELSSAEAVLLGALAPGVNAPTWSMLKLTFGMLGICLIAMLSLAFVSSDFIIIGNVLLLVIIGAALFILLNRIDIRKIFMQFLEKRGPSEYSVGFIFTPATFGISYLDKYVLRHESFLAQTGLVSVEQQMEEMGMSQKNSSTQKDKIS